MNTEGIVTLLLWLCFIGWSGFIIFLVGALKNDKTINEFYEYAKQLEAELEAARPLLEAAVGDGKAYTEAKHALVIDAWAASVLEFAIEYRKTKARP